MTLDNFPTTRPSFTANFARSQQMPPQVTFSRASTGTYVGENGLIQTTTNNTPRFTWENGRCQGLVIEQAKTNIALQSQNFTIGAKQGDTPWWYSDNGGYGAPGITINSGTAPDGTNTANLVEYDSISTSTYQTLLQNFTPTNTTYQASIWVKAATTADVGKTIKLQIYKGGTTVDLTSHVLTNQWVRIKCDKTFAAGVTGTAGFQLEQVVGQGAMSCLAWGAQIEASSYLTSYIPTTGSEVTRARDVVQINNLDFWSDEATLTAEYEVFNNNPYAFQWGFDGGAGTGAIQANPGAVTGMPDAGMLYITGTGTATYLGGNDNAWVTGEPLKAAYSWDCSAGEFSGFINHGTATPITETGFPIVPPRNRFAFGAFGTDMRNSTVWSYMAYYPTRASHDVLEALTQ